VKDPVNVVVKEKHFVVKNFYATLVKASRQAYMDAKSQSERWAQAVVLPLEVQIKDHKAQLQSRLDNLAKINEKTTSINEQMALLKAAENDLRKQREMIEGLIARVSAHAATSSLDQDLPGTTTTPQRPAADMMATTKLSTFETSPRVPTQPAPPPRPAEPARPLVSDDLMAGIGNIGKPAAAPAAGAFDPSKTQKMPSGADSTQKMSAADMERTQQAPAFNPESTQRIDASGKPPESTQRLPAAPLAPSADPESTQRIDDSVWRLEEAKRILSKIPQKN